MPPDRGPSHLPSSHPHPSQHPSLPSPLSPRLLALTEDTSPPAQAPAERLLLLTIPIPQPAVMATPPQAPSAPLPLAISNGQLNHHQQHHQQDTCTTNQALDISYPPPPTISMITTPAQDSYAARQVQQGLVGEGLGAIHLQLVIISRTLILCSQPLSDHTPLTHNIIIICIPNIMTQYHVIIIASSHSLSIHWSVCILAWHNSNKIMMNTMILCDAFCISGYL